MRRFAPDAGVAPRLKGVTGQRPIAENVGARSSCYSSAQGPMGELPTKRPPNARLNIPATSAYA
jgi:hypothetical protein